MFTTYADGTRPSDQEILAVNRQVSMLVAAAVWQRMVKLSFIQGQRNIENGQRDYAWINRQKAFAMALEVFPDKYIECPVRLNMFAPDFIDIRILSGFREVQDSPNVVSHRGVEQAVRLMQSLGSRARVNEMFRHNTIIGIPETTHPLSPFFVVMRPIE